MSAPKVEEIKLGSLDALLISHPTNGSSMKVCLFGATVYSYINSSGEEKLFLSASSKTDGSKPVRGGIPLVFPQFGPGRLASHGFARTSNWTFVDDVAVDGDTTTFNLTLSESEETMKLWPHKFKLDLNMKFSKNGFESMYSVTNTDGTDFRFQFLSHTYHLLPGKVDEIKIDGLVGLEYLDKLKPVGEMLKIQGVPLRVDQKRDSIYINESVKAKKVKVSLGNEQIFSVEMNLTENGEERKCDVVVWNPWKEDAKKMADFGDEEYWNMVCVEPGCVSRYEKCQAGSQWSLQQIVKYD